MAYGVGVRPWRRRGHEDRYMLACRSEGMRRYSLEPHANSRYDLELPYVLLGCPYVRNHKRSNRYLRDASSYEGATAVADRDAGFRVPSALRFGVRGARQEHPGVRECVVVIRESEGLVGRVCSNPADG